VSTPDAPLKDEELEKLNERFAGHRINFITDIMGGRLLDHVAYLQRQLEAAEAKVTLLEANQRTPGLIEKCETCGVGWDKSPGDIMKPCRLPNCPIRLSGKEETAPQK